MTATDELRRMLDERGVEHSDFASAYRLSTRWQDSGKRVIEHQLRKDADIGDMGIVRNLTPEQAIAATLGAWTCHATSNPPVPNKHWTGCSNCGSVWDFFYNICGYMGPPNFCPNCGAKVVDE